MIFKKVESKKAPIPKGCHSQAIQMGNLIFTSGQLPVDPVSGKFVYDGIEKQMVMVLENIKGFRHRHTHKFRYSDKNIKRLETLSLHEEFLNESKKILPTHTIPFIPNFKTEYRKIKNKWKKKFKKNDKDIKIVVNYCFKEINAIIFPGDGEISYPKRHGSIKE